MNHKFTASQKDRCSGESRLQVIIDVVIMMNQEMDTLSEPTKNMSRLNLTITNPTILVIIGIFLNWSRK